MFELRKIFIRSMLLGALCLCLDLAASNGFAGQTPAKWECQSCDYAAGGLELCSWNKPSSGECGEKPFDAFCFAVEACPPIEAD